MEYTALSDHLAAARHLAEERNLPIVVYLLDVALRALHSGRGGGKFAELLSSKKPIEPDFSWPRPPAPSTEL